MLIINKIIVYKFRFLLNPKVVFFCDFFLAAVYTKDRILLKFNEHHNYYLKKDKFVQPDLINVIYLVDHFI